MACKHVASVGGLLQSCVVLVGLVIGGDEPACRPFSASIRPGLLHLVDQSTIEHYSTRRNEKKKQTITALCISSKAVEQILACNVC
eukprot:6489903-Amphidinium_carterae.1